MNKRLLYNKAYRILNNSTPLKIDCGTLCENACCKGDENTGMHLFPGEEVMYDPNPEFITLKSTDLEIVSGENALLAVCKGTCIRSLRPLGCRIFPLTPYINENERLEIRLDPRALRLCPLAAYSDEGKLNRLFIRNVRKVFQILLQDNDIRNYVEKLSRILDEYARFYSK